MSYIGNQPSSAAFVTDSFSGNGTTTAFTMSVAPANTSSVLVAISGVLQDPTAYSVSGTTLTFSSAPPSGTGNISARYLGIPASGVTTTAYRTVTEYTATAGQTTFSPPSYTAGYINVYRNGVRLGAADYTASNGTTVVLTNAATLGDLITTESFYVSSVSNAFPQTGGTINASANATPLVVQKNGTTLATFGGSNGNVELVGSSNTLVLRNTDPTSYTSLRLFNDQNNAYRALEIDYMSSTYPAGEFGWVGTTGAYPILFGTNNTERIRIPSDSTGIKFPATSVSSSDANTLDDYEEGSWTPTFVGSSTNPTVTYTSQQGKYTKIGNFVFVAFKISWSASSGGSGLVFIGGLPFNTYNPGLDHPGGGTIGYASGMNGSSMLYADANTSRAVVMKIQTTSSTVAYQNTGDVSTSGGQIMGSFSYWIV